MERFKITDKSVALESVEKILKDSEGILIVSKKNFYIFGTADGETFSTVFPTPRMLADFVADINRIEGINVNVVETRNAFLILSVESYKTLNQTGIALWNYLTQFNYTVFMNYMNNVLASLETQGKLKY